MIDTASVSAQPQDDSSSLSYKFQRLREKLRAAIASGELAGKLPGERSLARRFHVNAKTLSKALTDLAAEGLLERSIGRGTYVKGSAPEPSSSKRWLVLCDPQQVGWEIIQLLKAAKADVEVLTDTSSVRPSFLNQFNAVIDLASDTPDTFIRDLVVRNIPVVVVGKDPKTYSTHSVAFDGQLGVSLLGRDLMLSGHRHLAAVEPRGCTVVVQSLRQAAARYAADAVIDPCFPDDVPTMIENGVTAFVCQSVEFASMVKQELSVLGIEVPSRVSLVAVGSTSDDQLVSGYFMSRSEKAAAIIQLLTQQTTRPTALWLAGRFADRGTLAPVAGHQGMLNSNTSNQRADAAA